MVLKIRPEYFNKFDENQKDFIQTATGTKFYYEFLSQHGKHLFVVGTTGSGKTQKGYAMVDWLCKRETQIWFDTGKTNEILPLLCMGLKVRIIIPTGTEIRIEENRQKIQNHPEVVKVGSPNEALDMIATGSYPDGHNIKRDTLTIISFRNSFSRKEMAVAWVAEFFELLAERCRMSTMPNIFPASLHVDESQWAMAGKRISVEGERSRASEVITENALELRSAGIRLVLYAQSYKNIPPAARENMLFCILCKGADISSDENGNLSKWCKYQGEGMLTPSRFKPWHGRFVFENGDSYPPLSPWKFRLYPKSEDDQEWIRHCRVVYEGRHDIRTGEDEIEEECFPELGRFSAFVIKPEKQKAIPGGRYEVNIQQEGIEDD